ncbi:MAG: S-adenosylmethionine:tRNA ribosyltransferase-isomerase [Bacteroidales bacterium]|nr:S-adenosylmethionine:tRNA ribosyltransferase-isomerase [Bacteroidales bacterium]
MNKLQNISISDYNYMLPQGKIALFPLDQRDNSKLIIYKNGIINEGVFKNIAQSIPANSLLIYNETKVIQARLVFQKDTGAKIEIFCLEPVSPTREIQLAFNQKSYSIWKCMIGNSKKWKIGDLVKNFVYNKRKYKLIAKRKNQLDNTSLIEFKWYPEDLTFSEILEISGLVPLPPYLNREAVESDKIRYQTVYAKNNGSVAAPTAGLHFTENVFNSLKEKKIQFEQLTLHVSAGTFKPVSSPTIKDHQMHTEQIFIKKNTIKKILQNINGNIISVGTTTLRTLESLYWFGVKLIINDYFLDEFFIEQWFPYDKKYLSKHKQDFTKISVKDSLSAVIKYLDKNNLNTLTGTTQLIIVPGYEFRIAKGIITNFHQPKSTLLLLVAAFIGKDWKKVYEYALSHNFRFLSYGDSCLFFNKLKTND